VHDGTLHLPGSDIGRLSAQRDRYGVEESRGEPLDYEVLAAVIERSNEE
jgi:hypothetical protein